MHIPRKLTKSNRREVLDILDMLQFFQGQRAGRELWFNKPIEVQEQDLENFNRDVRTIRDYIWDLEKELKSYKDLEEQGLLHKAEIKDGTPIWYIASLDDEGPFLIKSSYIYNVTEYEVGDLEKDFWLSEEEAEKVLAEMKGE